jgi:bifunctional DNA-binding transcriptional regulator/antitoxin component of YhaV-PrlF toxin-antitoxin module
VSERVKTTRRRGFTRLSSKRQVTLPLAVVRQLGLVPGDALRVDAEGDRVVLRRPESLADRRLRALEQVAGGLAGAYEPGYLDRLRDEWR